MEQLRKITYQALNLGLKIGTFGISISYMNGTLTRMVRSRPCETQRRVRAKSETKYNTFFRGMYQISSLSFICKLLNTEKRNDLE
jgi:hypothetical protein